MISEKTNRKHSKHFLWMVIASVLTPLPLVFAWFEIDSDGGKIECRTGKILSLPIAKNLGKIVHRPPG